MADTIHISRASTEDVHPACEEKPGEDKGDASIQKNAVTFVDTTDATILTNDLDQAIRAPIRYKAGCILPRPNAATSTYFGPETFFIKARLQSAILSTAQSSGSVKSLDSSSKLPGGFRRSFGGLNSRERVKTSNVTACRSAQFNQTLELPLPKSSSRLIRSKGGSTTQTMLSRRRSMSASEMECAPIQLELYLELKQRGRPLLRGLGGKFCNDTLGRVSIPCSPVFLRTLEAASDSRSHSASFSSPNEDYVTRVELLTPVGTKPIEGLLNLAMQWNQATRLLTLRPIDLSSFFLPVGTKKIVAVFSLMTNHQVLETQESRPAVKVALNQCEFHLTDEVAFKLEGGMESGEVCVGIALVATIGGLKSGQVVIGRLVVGPTNQNAERGASPLAYGSGMLHWNAVARHRGMIRRRHWLC
ncbi:unnamed protein product [Mesocestoides corti]|uniref:Uncharacterized protein n=1 Tax=Mesocestoides corti TaxID=53468 RepID=A0A0R3UH54_MESCO|nr:unnamed protein product [Mesocestoides corti]